MKTIEIILFRKSIKKTGKIAVEDIQYYFFSSQTKYFMNAVVDANWGFGALGFNPPQQKY